MFCLDGRRNLPRVWGFSSSRRRPPSSLRHRLPLPRSSSPPPSLPPSSPKTPWTRPTPSLWLCIPVGRDPAINCDFSDRNFGKVCSAAAAAAKTFSELRGDRGALGRGSGEKRTCLPGLEWRGHRERLASALALTAPTASNLRTKPTKKFVKLTELKTLLKAHERQRRMELHEQAAVEYQSAECNTPQEM